MKRLRLALAAFVDTWNGTSAYYALHQANADRARLADVCCHLRGENERLEALTADLLQDCRYWQCEAMWKKSS